MILSRRATSGLMALVALLAAVLVASPADAAPRWKVDVRVSASAVPAGSPVTVSGSLAPNASGKSVAIQANNAGTWVQVAVVKTNSRGVYSFTLRPKQAVPTYVRVYKPASNGYNAGVSVTRRIDVLAVPTLSVTSTGPTAIAADEEFVLNGTASAHLVGKAVQLQWYDAARRTWVTLGSSTVASNRSFSVRGKALTAGQNQAVRAVAPATRTTAAAATKNYYFQVYRWTYLRDLRPVEGNVRTGSWSVNGTTYARSVGMRHNMFNKSSSVSWNLGRDCSRFRATVGQDDTSPSGTTWSLELRADDATRWSKGGMKLGQSHVVDIDVRNALRLSANLTSSDEGTFVYGDARVLCAP
ncbi:MAG TPA: NPCBM/NEW2 domain-containing protein [Nocardioides sp.]